MSTPSSPRNPLHPGLRGPPAQAFAGRKIDEARLSLAADIISYLNVILVLRGWSLKRRHDSMDVVMDGILEFVEHAIEFVEEGDRDT